MTNVCLVLIPRAVYIKDSVDSEGMSTSSRMKPKKTAYLQSLLLSRKAPALAPGAKI
jgi:hypothetical protein